ncbi:MAG: capsule assembly Wzi family protein [Treponema sp.]|jgi:hypothetical protein|nr:capsule assembly Wzi family protein [Treponema sp.]
MKKYFFLIFTIAAFQSYAQEILLSPNEVYYDFLSLGGYIERPYLNYRTLSDSTWDDSENTNTIWSNVNLGLRKKVNDQISYKIYGPELLTSYNTANPYGQNDSTLWQGRGFNMLFSAGARLELYGFELTLRPEFAFSQNASFDLVPPAYSSGEAAKYGYYGLTSVDAPQRFGDAPYYEFSWGGSEIRYSWKTLTVGFGTQNVWLGPAKINPILLSNNAPPWPKLDIGLRKQPIIIHNKHFGDIEARLFWGLLSESDYFDDDNSNNRNLIAGLSMAYSFPAYLKGFTIGVNRIMLSKWDNLGYSSIFSAFLFPNSMEDANDQRITLSLSYLFSSIGFELYFEWGRNDMSNFNSLFRELSDSEAYTFGAAKNLIFSNTLQGRLLFEISHIGSARVTPQSFYVHHIVTQGHTNRGQWIGAGLGTGGNSQYLGFTLFYQKGYADLFIQRQGIDSDYVRYGSQISNNQKALFSFGIDNYINVYKYLGLYSGIIYSHVFNPTFDADKYPHNNNFYFSMGIKIIL